MMNYRTILYVFALALLIQLSSCGRQTPKKNVLTPIQAHQALDSIYAGSLASLPLDPRFQAGMSTELTKDTAEILRDQFGTIKEIQLQSSGNPTTQIEETIWTVSAEKRSFEMKIWQHDGRISGFFFRPSAAQDWGPVPMIGVEYARHGRLPAGW
jgi:hypothetical protein